MSFCVYVCVFGVKLTKQPKKMKNMHAEFGKEKEKGQRDKKC